MLQLAQTLVFFAEILKTFSTYQCLQNYVQDFLYLVYNIRVIDKPGFCECVATTLFLIFANNSRSKRNKNSPEHTFVGIGNWEASAKF